MNIKHYATFSILGKGFFPQVKTFNLPTNEITQIQIPGNTIKIVTFDRVVEELSYQGKKIPVASKALNKKAYHIGTFKDIKQYLGQGQFYDALAQSNCIGMVLTKNGKDNIVYKGEEVIDPKYISKEGFYSPVKEQAKEKPRVAQKAQENKQNNQIL